MTHCKTGAWIFGEKEFGECIYLLHLVLWHSVEEVWTNILFPISFLLVSILFHFSFVSFCIGRPHWASDKSTRQPVFWVSKDNCLEDIYRPCISYYIDALFSLPISWIFLVFLPKTPTISLHSFPQSWKIWQNRASLPKITAKILARSIKNSRIFWQNQDVKHWELKKSSNEMNIFAIF